MGSAETDSDAFGTSSGLSPSCDTMLRGGLIRIGRGTAISTYLQDLWELADLQNTATVVMGKIQQLFSDAAFRRTATMLQIRLVCQASMLQALRVLSVTLNSMLIDGPWMGLNGRDERPVTREALGQLRNVERCDVSILSEEACARVFGLRTCGKFWHGVAIHFTIMHESCPNAVDATRYLPPQCGLDKHIVLVGSSVGFLDSSLLRGEQEEGVSVPC